MIPNDEIHNKTVRLQHIYISVADKPVSSVCDYHNTLPAYLIPYTQHLKKWFFSYLSMHHDVKSDTIDFE